MRTKIFILFILLTILAGAGAFYWAEHQKLEQVDLHVRHWQQRMSEYVTFEYGAISTRLGPNTLTLEQVYVSYPLLMSIDKLIITSHPGKKNSEKKMERLFISAQGINFTWPSITANAPWYGNMAIDYKYHQSAKQLDLFINADFPRFITGELQTTLLGIVPDIDIVFTYPDVLLTSLEVELQNLGLLEKMGQGQISDQQLLAFLDKLTNNDQRQTIAEFWSNRTPIIINFYPEYPVPLYRLMEAPQLFWQHPSVEMRTQIKLL